jgi:hypothetical protein
MEKGDKFELRIVESMEAYPPPDEREGIAATDLVTTPEEALEALKATKGAEAVLKQIPLLDRPELWFSTAYFSVCRKSGTAKYLDLWDLDAFDGFTDMGRCVSDCRAWFAGDGFEFWGSGETKTGRVNCYFTAPSEGWYTCNAKLQSYPSNELAIVECFMDSSSFGQLPVFGTINQPHQARLSAGGHHFRIRQVSGSFFFLSLTVWAIPVNAP